MSAGYVSVARQPRLFSCQAAVPRNQYLANSAWPARVPHDVLRCLPLLTASLHVHFKGKTHISGAAESLVRCNAVQGSADEKATAHLPWSEASVAPKDWDAENVGSGKTFSGPEAMPLGYDYMMDMAETEQSKQESDQGESDSSDSTPQGVEDEDRRQGEGVLRKLEGTIVTPNNRFAHSYTGTGDREVGLGQGTLGPYYEVLVMDATGSMSSQRVQRRGLLRTTGLRPRDLRCIVPSLAMYNSSPAMLVRKNVLVLSFAGVRALVCEDSLLMFDPNSAASQVMMDVLINRMGQRGGLQHTVDQNAVQGVFEFEVVEAALIAATSEIDKELGSIGPQVKHLLTQAVPKRLTPGYLEELRSSKQKLVEVASRADSLRQMLLEVLEEEEDIQRMAVRNLKVVCRSHLRGSGAGATGEACTNPSEEEAVRLIALAEEEIENLLEYYMARFVSIHVQAERLLAEARDMESSISVSLSSRRYEVNRLELVLSVATFAVGIGAMVAGDGRDDFAVACPMCSCGTGEAAACLSLTFPTLCSSWKQPYDTTRAVAR
eukprot:jgi/Mesvir1/22634/Mv14070-RA.2